MMGRAEALKFAEEMRDKLSYRLECAEKVPARSYYEKQWEMLVRAIAALREQEQSQWISVKERLPENSEDVVVCHRNGWVTKDAWLGSNWWYQNDVNPITHWMPLPEPPKEGDEG